MKSGTYIDVFYDKGRFMFLKSTLFKVYYINNKCGKNC